DQERERANLVSRQRHDREQQGAQRKAAIAKVRSDRDLRIDHLKRIARFADAEDVARGDNAAERATRAQTEQIVREVRASTDARARQLAKDIRAEEQRHAKIEDAVNKKWDKASGALTERHKGERAAMRLQHKEALRDVGGELMRKMRSYTRALHDFQRAVYDNPSDEYRDFRAAAYMNRLLEGEHNAALVDATEHRLRSESHLSQSEVDKIHHDPAKLRELVAQLVEDVYRNPVNFDPELVDAVAEARDEATKAAIDETNTLIAQGFHPQWLPAANIIGGRRSAASVIIGKGVPHVDVGFARTQEVVNSRYDVVLGASKAMSQTLSRDATIDFVEHSIVPRTITGDELRAQLHEFGMLEDFDPEVGTLTHAQTSALARLGLRKFDPTALFGFSMPRWESKATYLPDNLVTALEKTMEERAKGDMGVWDKGTRLFRMSILGLSPRYTAHIVFGGSFLLALRSTPYMFRFLGDAAKAMRDGSLPEGIYRTPPEEGFARFDSALREHGRLSGKQLSNLAIQEHVERVQKIGLAAAKPLHLLKAAADLNYRFTRAAVRMQSAVAYLDYSAAAERRGWFIDEVTGERRTMTKERAMHEGMAHVEEVFGNLRNMSPFERQIAKNILPFYGWTRHILNYVLSFPSDHPWRAMVLSLMAFENSENVPKGLPERIQFLFFLGSPNAQGNVSAIDTRFMNPLRDIANYATLGGWLQGLNPAILAPLAMMDPQVVYGANELYPNVSYNQFYGIETAGAQGSALTGLEQFVPQLGALGSAIQVASGSRQLAATNKNAFYKSVFNSLNIPFAQIQKINVRQIAAHDEIARYNVAKTAAQNAFSTGNFSGLAGYSSVPNPLNPDYEISVTALEALYNQALAATPGVAPVASLTPPITPPGF
ncbi:MAG TPA: hypothetical protein VMU73_08940, partial [Gaiellaceae bacterium]|nr:hypothetical protein [Gaiellaceae bacterium]